MGQTTDELLTKWARRDALYAHRKQGGYPQPLTEAEVESVKAWRLQEARTIGAGPEAFARLRTWVPPRMSAL